MSNITFSLSLVWKTRQALACVASGVSRASALVLVEKPWTRVAKPWEDWWRVELNSGKFTRGFAARDFAREYGGSAARSPAPEYRQLRRLHQLLFPHCLTPPPPSLGLRGGTLFVKVVHPVILICFYSQDWKKLWDYPSCENYREGFRTSV